MTAAGLRQGVDGKRERGTGGEEGLLSVSCLVCLPDRLPPASSPRPLNNSPLRAACATVPACGAARSPLAAAVPVGYASTRRLPVCLTPSDRHSQGPLGHRLERRRA